MFKPSVSEGVVLSHFQAKTLLEARKAAQTKARVSLDLGLTLVEVNLEPERVLLPDGQSLSWDSLSEIVQHETTCFVAEAGAVSKIQVFSERLQRFYSLMPTQGAPTILIAGFPMHRIKGVDPYRDTLLKIRAVAPVRGQVLDTATGLGYTAIEAAKTAEQVTTIELDELVLRLARLNPWSRALPANPRIRQLVGDAVELLPGLDDAAFTRIIHDPPTLSLAGELYSDDFYRQLFRVLKRGGRLYHYIGDLASPFGRRVAKGVGRRLKVAGFERVVRRPEAFGMVAFKV